MASGEILCLDLWLTFYFIKTHKFNRDLRHLHSAYCACCCCNCCCVLHLLFVVVFVYYFFLFCDLFFSLLRLQFASLCRVASLQFTHKHTLAHTHARTHRETGTPTATRTHAQLHTAAAAAEANKADTDTRAVDVDRS